MNREEIEKVDKALKYANEYNDYLDKKHSELYKECGYAYEYIIPNNYEVERKIKELEYIKEVLEN